MKNAMVLCTALSLLAVFFVGIGAASDTDSVSCTATFTQLGVTVSPSSYDFGFGQANDWSNTTDVSSDYFTVTNEGNNNEKFWIQATADGGNTWSLAATNDEDTAVMKASSTDADIGSTPVSIHSQTALDNSVASSGSVHFDLHFQFPSSTGTYTQQSFTVTVTAVEV